ncbi:unnamed protein product [Anisakis simplex]|uniref:SPATA6 domain-containing protein n=1 Tax=Anisakis simplex TaxID=6269 RepID=A0A0M3K128_ANISI|nr:unnamed protein product [Anisakis simplex]
MQTRVYWFDTQFKLYFNCPSLIELVLGPVSNQSALTLAWGLEFILDKDEIDDLVLYIKGYYKLAIGSELLCTYCDVTSDDTSKPFVPFMSKEARSKDSILAPLYRSIHTVFSSGWNYSIDCSPGEKLVNLSLEPPSYSIAVATCPEVKQQHQSLDRTGETERFSSSSDTEETSSRRDSGLNKSEYHRKTLAKHQNNYRTSFDFDSTNQLTSTESSDLLNKKNDVNKILMSTSEKICLDADLIDLTASSLGDDRIHTFATRSASDMSSLSSEGLK